MTNTQASREAFEQFVKSDYDHEANLKTENYETIVYKDDDVEIMWMAWQASQAQQASEIEALKHDLYSYMEASNGYVNEIMKQAHTIAELVEALERAKDMVGHEDNIAFIDAAIAKVKGK